MRLGWGIAAVRLTAAIMIASGWTEPARTEAPLSLADEIKLAGAQDDAHTAFAHGPGASANTPSRDPATFLLFASTDVWRHGGFTYGGVQWAPNGVDNAGAVIKLMLGGGLYRYVSGALGNRLVTGQQFSAAILPGWRFVKDKLFVTVFAGGEFQNHDLSPDDPSAGLRGASFGVRTGFDVWYEPTGATMVAADASLSSIGLSYSARLAAGLRVFNLLYFGPEVQTFAAGNNYRTFRAGLHLTGLRTGSFEWTAGLGWALDSDERNSLYGKLGVITKR